MCLKEGRITQATMADHIQEHGGDWNEFRLGAIQSLCSNCHNSRKRYLRSLGYGQAIGQDGWPIDPNHPANK
jgi:hypothetical protein